MKQEALGESWFDEPPLSERPFAPDSLDEPVVVHRGRVGWAMGLAAVGGALGGAAMLFTASEIARRWGMPTDVVRAVGAAVPSFGEPFRAGLIFAAVLGAAVGVPFGALTQYSLRVRARVLSGVLLATSLWTLVQAFVLPAVAPRLLAVLPYGPMVAGAAVYGLLVVFVPPPRVKMLAA